MSINNRIKKIENQICPQKEPEFRSWGDDEWTAEEKAAALRKHPGCTRFWKTLSSTLTLEETLRRKAAGESLENRGARYIAGPADPSEKHEFLLRDLHDE
jgi:hypothetical protein